MNVSLKGAIGSGGFSWPKPIARAPHPAMLINTASSISDAFRIGVVGTVDGSELILPNCPNNNPIRRINAAGAVVWSLTATQVRAASNQFIGCFYDGQENYIYVVSGNPSTSYGGVDNLYVDKVNVVTGAVNTISPGAISVSGFLNGTLSTANMRLVRFVAGEGNLLLISFVSGDLKKIELSPVNGSVVVANTQFSAANGSKVSNILGYPIVTYFSADGAYAIGNPMEMVDSNSRAFPVLKNGLYTLVGVPFEGANCMISNISYGSEWLDFCLVDNNTVAKCSVGMGTRYYNRTEFDAWLKKLVDAEGV